MVRVRKFWGKAREAENLFILVKLSRVKIFENGIYLSTNKSRVTLDNNNIWVK